MSIERFNEWKIDAEPTLYVSNKLESLHCDWINDDLNELLFTFSVDNTDAYKKSKSFIECGIPFALVYNVIDDDIEKYIMLLFDGKSYSDHEIFLDYKVDYQNTKQSKLLKSLHDFDENKIDIYRVMKNI